jgi:GNAT superfamily N-acetyltransferase
VSPERFRSERFESARHDRSGFSCGEEELDRYFREFLSQDLRRRAAVAYVLVEQETNAVAGYYTLSATAFAPEGVPDALAKRLPRYASIPAILLGRFAVDRAYQGQGVGKRLLADVFIRYLAVEQIGHVGLVLDAMNDNALAFWKRAGFVQFESDLYRMFLPHDTIIKLAT